ncbi:MAG TPA: hypothetical protein VKX25_05565 [Bryobacteraceae bacterium]|jgi:hypothetical protein|nr:hypothetical protein [Bryobacteraceae bacterium]
MSLSFSRFEAPERLREIQSKLRVPEPCMRALIISGLLAAIFFSVGYWRSPERPTAPGQGWLGYWDQAAYYRSIAALEAHDFDPSQHRYPLGYPLIGSLLYPLTPLQPFFVPDALCYLGFALALTAVALRFISPVESILVCFFGLIRSSIFLRAYVVPWTNIPVNTALAVLSWLVLTGRKDRFAGIVTGICASLIFTTRPGDLVFTLPLIAAYWFGCRTWGEARERLVPVVFGALPFTLLDVLLSFAIYGSLISEAYRTATVFMGYGLKGLPIRLYTFLIDSHLLFPEKNTLVTVYPFLLLIVPGIIVFVKRYRWQAGVILLAQFGCLLYFFSYNDFWISHIFVFGAMRYILWVVPFCFLYAYLSIRLAWRVLGVPLTLGLMILPILLWSLPQLSLYNVAYQLPESKPSAWPCIPGAGRTCHLHMEFAEPEDFDVIKVRGTREETLTWSTASLDGHREQMFRDYYAGDESNGETYIFFYTRQKTRSIDLTVSSEVGPVPSFVFSNLQLARYRLGFALRSPFRRFHQ